MRLRGSRRQDGSDEQICPGPMLSRVAGTSDTTSALTSHHWSCLGCICASVVVRFAAVAAAVAAAAAVGPGVVLWFDLSG